MEATMNDDAMTARIPPSAPACLRRSEVPASRRQVGMGSIVASRLPTHKRLRH